jgi:hypothetical protein
MGQSRVNRSIQDNPLKTDIRSIIVNHPDTSVNILPGVGENWPLGRQDTARWNSVFRRNILLNCDMTRTLIALKALEYLGTLYRYGQSSEKGFDCSGYVMYIFRTFGFNLPHSSLAQYGMSRKLDESEAKPGDLVFFKTRSNRISHVGIYLGDNMFVHSPGKGRRVTTESLDFPYYRNRLVGFGSVL